MRPRYETSETLAAEALARLKVQRAWGVRLWKIPDSYRIDCAITLPGRKEVIGWAEIKCRDCDREQYPSYILAVSKWEMLLRMQERTRLPSVVVFDWLDTIGWLPAEKISPVVTINGRFDRGDPDDVEPVVWIGHSQFAPLAIRPSFGVQR